MAEEIKNEEALPVQGTDSLEEAQALNEMSKKVKTLEAQNAELMAAKKRYYDSILNGSTVEENAPKTRSKNEIRKELFVDRKEDLSNLEYAKLVVELDEACIREDGESCFLPKGKDVEPTADERQTAERFRECLVDCIEEAEGDEELFNQALARRTRKKK